MQIDKWRITTFDKWLSELIDVKGSVGEQEEEMKTRMAFTWWYIWKARNKAVLEDSLPQPFEVISRINMAVQEYFYAIEKYKRQQVIKKVQKHRGALEKWRKPDVGVVKINCDGAFEAGGLHVGIGGLAGDADANLLGCFGGRIKCESALTAEAHALLRGAKLAANKGWQNVALETDSRVMFSVLTSKKDNEQWRVAHFVAALEELKKAFVSFRINLVRRSANSRADKIAH